MARMCSGRDPSWSSLEPQEWESHPPPLAAAGLALSTGRSTGRPPVVDDLSTASPVPDRVSWLSCCFYWLFQFCAAMPVRNGTGRGRQVVAKATKHSPEPASAQGERGKQHQACGVEGTEDVEAASRWRPLERGMQGVGWLPMRLPCRIEAQQSSGKGPLVLLTRTTVFGQFETARLVARVSLARPYAKLCIRPIMQSR